MEKYENKRHAQQHAPPSCAALRPRSYEAQRLGQLGLLEIVGDGLEARVVLVPDELHQDALRRGQVGSRAPATARAWLGVGRHGGGQLRAGRRMGRASWGGCVRVGRGKRREHGGRRMEHEAMLGLCESAKTARALQLCTAGQSSSYATASVLCAPSSMRTPRVGEDRNA